MEIVVRTPHGDADVSIVCSSAATTLGDAIAAITGQAVPRVAMVDGRTVDATTPLSDVGLSLGAVVTTEPTLPDARSDDEVDLVQVGGLGAGRVVPLGPGRYRIGPGRRSTADELDVAPVEDPAFELVVTSTTTVADVTIVPTRSDVALDGVALAASTSWRDGTLTAGSRAFELEIPASPTPDRSLPMADPDGTVAFSRPPRSQSSRRRRPVVDALREASGAAPTLWERRPAHRDAYVLAFGVHVLGSDPATVQVDLRADRAVAVAGSERFRSALARSLIVEAATAHGPADLDVVVLTGPDRLAAWEWCKWLPHVRLDGSPALVASPHEVRRWAERVRGETPVPWTSPHLSMVVIDDPGLWNRRDAPLRTILSNPPEDVRLIALCDDPRHAPAVCTALIAEDADGLAQLQSFTGHGDVEHVHAALTEPDVALLIARSLAPLADVDLPPNPAPPDDEASPDQPAGVLDEVSTAEVLAHWQTGAASDTVVIGHRAGHPVRVDVDADVTVVVGPTMRDAFDVAASAVVLQCAERPPDALWIVPLMWSERSELLWRLPHASEPHDGDAAIEPGRLLDRLRALVSGADGPDRVVIVCEADRTTAADPVLLSALADGVRQTDGVTMIAVTDRSDLSVPGAGTVIAVERHDDRRGRSSRVARMIDTDDDADDSFLPLQPATRRSDALELRPYVVGRALTTLERRLEQRRAQLDDIPNPALVDAVNALREAAHGHSGTRAEPGTRLAVPAPMPTVVSLVSLFETSPGDGVPLGIEDDPQTGGVRTRWWQPGQGSLLLFGSRRSGVEQVVSTITLGVLDRFPSDDVVLLSVEPSPARRRALADVDRDVRGIAPDDAQAVAEALDVIAAAIDSTAPRSTGDPHLVVLVSDLADLRRHHAGRSLGERIDEVLVAAAASGRVDVVAYASTLDDAGPFATAAASRLVGASSNHADLEVLGVEHPDDLDGIVGRCRSLPDGDLVQLATSDTTFEQLLAQRSSGSVS